MKRYSYTLVSLFVLALGFTSSIRAQVSVMLQLSPPYHLNVSEYASHPHQMVLVLTNTSMSDQHIQLSGTITSNVGVSAHTNSGFQSPAPITLHPGESRNLFGNDLAELFQTQSLSYEGIDDSDLNRGFVLPQGNYTICIMALDYYSHQPISLPGTGCSNFTVSSIAPPNIIAPYNSQVVSQLPFQIIWSPMPGSPPGVQYTVRLLELMPGVDPNYAFSANNWAYYESPPLMINTMLYGPELPQLIAGKQYALMVVVSDPLQRVHFQNNGRSKPVVFTYQPFDPSGGDPAALNDPFNAFQQGMPDCSCKLATPPAGTNHNGDLHVGDQVMVNNFEMKITELNNDGETLSGKGTIPLPMMGNGLPVRIRVEFTELVVNAQKKMLAGNVQGIVSGSAMGLIPNMDNPSLSTIPLNTGQVNNLDNFFTQNANHLTSSASQAANSIGFELPLGVDAGPITVGITAARFTATQGWMEAIAVMRIPDGNTKVAFSGRGICISPSDICGDALLYLSEDFTIAQTGLVLKGGVGANRTHILYDKEGFKRLFIEAEYTFGQYLTHADNGGNVKATLSSDTDGGWSDWIAECSIEPFKIANLSDFRFDLASDKKIYYDHSSTRRVDGMPQQFASGDGEVILVPPTWTGFYIPEIGLTLPSAIKTISGNSVKIEATDLIFDEGITGNVQVTQGLPKIGEGSLGGWYMSIDAIGLKFWRNSFKQSYMNGKVVLPVSGHNPSVSNQLEYSCTLTKPAGGDVAFSFSMTPKDNLGFSALYAKARVCQGSSIQVNASGNGFEATATLNGYLSITLPIDAIPDLSLGCLQFDNLKLSTNASNLIQGGTWNAGLFASCNACTPASSYNGLYGSPYPLLAYNGTALAAAHLSEDALSGESSQQSMFGFNLNLDGISPVIESGNTTKFGLRFDTRLQLAANANFIPKAEAIFKIYAQLHSQDGRTLWKGFGGEIEKIKLEAGANIGGMGITGDITYYNINAGGTHDHALGGRLGITLPGALAAIQMKALFGSRTTQSDKFNYFYFDAMVELQPGIVMFPGTAITGFAGGVSYHMNRQDFVVKNSEGSNVMNGPDSFVSITSYSGIKYVPNKNAGLGIQAGVLFGLSSVHTLQGLVNFSVVFNNNFGFKEIGLNGNGYMLGSGGTFEERRSKSIAKATFDIKAKFENGSFDQFMANFGYTIDYLVLRAQGNVEFYVDKMTNWYFKMGIPWDQGEPMELEINALIYKVTSQSYFQCGNYGLDNLPRIPDEISAILNGGTSENGSDDDRGSVQSQSKSFSGPSKYDPLLQEGQGFLIGAKYELKVDAKLGIFYASLYGGVGADVMLQHFPQGLACGSPGNNIYWYAKGQAYAGAMVDVGVRVKVLGIRKEISFVYAGIGAEIEAGAPDPIYARGRLRGSFSVLGGLISGNYGMNFTYGQFCSTTNQSEELELISEIYPADKSKNLKTNEEPFVSFNFSLKRDFIVPFIYENSDGEVTNVIYKVFRFSPDYVDITLNGGTINYTRQSFKADDYYLRRNVSEFLDPHKEYRFEVKAKVKKYTMSDTFSSAFFQGSRAAAKGTAKMVANANNRTVDAGFAWVMETDDHGNPTNKVYVDKRTSVFTTGAGPKTLDVGHVDELWPYHRHPLLPANNAVIGGKGAIRLNFGYRVTSFSVDGLANPRPYVRLVEVDNENVNTFDREVTISNNGLTWDFFMPTGLMPGKKYAMRLFLKGEKQNTNSSTSTLKMVKSTAVFDGNTSHKYRVYNRKVMEDGLKMSANEHELFSWYFNTSTVASTYKSKLELSKVTKLTIGDTEEFMANENGTFSETDIERIQQNLDRLNWEPDENTKTIRAMSYSYSFTGPESFAVQDDVDYKRDQLLPSHEGRTKNVKWKSMMSRFGNPQDALNLNEGEIKAFIENVFGEGKELKILIDSWEGNYYAGTTRVQAFRKMHAPIHPLADNMYGIDMMKYQYGYEEDSNSEPSGPNGSSGSNSSPWSSTPMGGFVASLSQFSGITAKTVKQVQASGFGNAVQFNPFVHTNITATAHLDITWNTANKLIYTEGARIVFIPGIIGITKLGNDLPARILKSIVDPVVNPVDPYLQGIGVNSKPVINNTSVNTVTATGKMMDNLLSKQPNTFSLNPSIGSNIGGQLKLNLK